MAVLRPAGGFDQLGSWPKPPPSIASVQLGNEKQRLVLLGRRSTVGAARSFIVLRFIGPAFVGLALDGENQVHRGLDQIRTLGQSPNADARLEIVPARLKRSPATVGGLLVCCARRSRLRPGRA